MNVQMTPLPTTKLRAGAIEMWDIRAPRPRLPASQPRVTAPDASQVAHLPPPSVPQVNLTPELRSGAAAFAQSIAAVTETLHRPLTATAKPNAKAEHFEMRKPITPVVHVEQLDDSTEMICAFLKLALSNQSGTLSVQFALHELASYLRDVFGEAASKKREEARETTQRADLRSELLSMARRGTNGMMMLLSIASIATGGALAPVVAILTLVSQVGFAVADNKTNNLYADALALSNNALRFDVEADRAQEQLEDEAEIIRRIMELGNETVDAVMRLLNLNASSQLVILSAGMVR